MSDTIQEKILRQQVKTLRLLLEQEQDDHADTRARLAVATQRIYGFEQISSAVSHRVDQLEGRA